MPDYRALLIQSIEESLLTVLSPDALKTVSDKIICVLNDYEVTKRCTEIVTYDDINERLLKRYCACLKIDGKSDNSSYRGGYSRGGNTMENLQQMMDEAQTEQERDAIRRVMDMM